MISVTVPIYNEQDSILPLFESIRRMACSNDLDWEVIFVNDGSRDRSGEILDRLAAREPRVKVVHFRRNFGQTAAMMAGFEHARGNVIVPMDGDLQNDPEDIPRLLAKLDEGYDVVSGWRQDRHDDVLRTLLSQIANRIISDVSGVHLHDFGCSLKAYRREVIKDVKLYGEMHRFIPIYASWQGARIAEISVRHHARHFGVSKYGLIRILKVVFDLMVVKFLAEYSHKPMYVFGAVSLGSICVSVFSSLWACYLKFFRRTTFIQTPLPLVAVMTFFNSFICLLLGFLAEMLMRTYHESQKKATYLVAAVRNLE